MAESRPQSEADTLSARTHETYAALSRRSDFVELRRRYTHFAFPAAIAFMVWYVAYILCNNWARDFLDTPVIGNVNVAVVFGLLQFVSTFAIAAFYARHATRVLDPLASRLQEDFEDGIGR